MHYLYILYSKSTDRFYVGQSSDVLSRLDLHNTHHFKGAFTKIASDWEIAMAFPCTQKKDALFLERFVKRMKSKAFIRKVIAHPEILTAILANQ
ncbi:MAG TPA: GIY-YIG nuclease family protein [Flavobacteriaceae bacterium]|nr:GIY-YIG nuclease family protein [Flavobacteriaceae bacterium]